MLYTVEEVQLVDDIQYNQSIQRNSNQINIRKEENLHQLEVDKN
jgi:hypothetical protein